MPRLVVLVCLALAAVPTVSGQEPAERRHPAGTDSVDALLDAVYRTVSFPAGETPDWDRLRELLLPDALIVQPATRGRGIRTLDVDGFVRLFVDDIERYRMSEVGFAERVVATAVTEFGDIASAQVVFEARLLGEPGRLPQRGLDLFQLVEKDGRWFIASIATQFERPDDPLPAHLYTARFLERIDHLVCATPDLDATIDDLERVLGVRPVAGGGDAAPGTRSARLSLGSSTFLEIVGPDSQQAAPEGGRPFGIDRLGEARLVNWAANTGNLEETRSWSAAHGLDLGATVVHRSLDGAGRVSRGTAPGDEPLVPFFVERDPAWRPPVAQASTAAVLVGLRAEHPDPTAARSPLRALGLGLTVAVGPERRLIATVATPRGLVELR
ncbi:MAG: VOC family protein [Planctomycetes bacterium]|nr:VOC family protein [Planctomycetota bacterium]